MSALTDRIDRFVRWFFNVSPTVTAIEPRRPSRHQPGRTSMHRPDGGERDASGGRRGMGRGSNRQVGA